jgi:uncharacterized protein DUF3105
VSQTEIPKLVLVGREPPVKPPPPPQTPRRDRDPHGRRRHARAKPLPMPWWERTLIGVASLAVAFVLIALLSGYFQNADQAAVDGSAVVGLQYASQGDALLAAASPDPTYDSNPPTSGPHHVAPVTANGKVLSDDQILTALALGNIVVLYGTRRPPAGLTAIAGPLDPELVRIGQAVVLGRRPGIVNLIALSWTRMLSVSLPSDSLLREFIQEWQGIGAAGSKGR